MTKGNRLSWRQAAKVVVAFEALAVAVWLVPASVHIVAWPDAGPSRIALFASRARLMWLTAGGLAAAFALLGRGGARVPALSDRVAPFAILWLWAVPFLPWLPDRLPLLLVFAGPLRWLVLALAVSAALRLDRAISRALEQERRLPGRRSIFGISLALYLGLGLHSAALIGPGGDEPHYLIISQSLLADGDLRIENNHRRHEYDRFFAGDLKPDYLRRGVDGEIYSVHAPGLPVLLLPVYAVAGYYGAVAFMCFLGALAALAVFDLADALAGRRAAFLTWLAVCLTVPFVPYSWLIFPEIPGAVLVAWAVLWLWRPVEECSDLGWAGRGLALAVLPWLHTKFSVFLGVFGVALVLRLWGRARTAAAFSAPIAASLALWFGFFYVTYGELNPSAPYGSYATEFIVPANIPRSILGLLFDQKFGLLFYSPVYLFAIAGGWIMLRRRDLRRLGATLVVMVVVFVGGATELYMWWGGNSAPARYLVPLLPCLAPMVAVAVAAASGAWSRALLGTWLALSLSVAAAGTLWPDRFLIFSDPHGRARLLELVEAGSPLAFSMPTFTEFDWRTPLLHLVPWLAAAGLGLTALLVLARARRLPTLWLAACGALVSLVAAGLVAPQPLEARHETAERGAVDVMWRFDPGRLRPYSLSKLTRPDVRQLLAMSTVAVAVRHDGDSPDSGATAGPFDLPEGEYEARVWFSGARGREGTVVVSSSPHAVFGEISGALGNPTVVPFDLPVAVDGVAIHVTEPSAAAAVMRIDIAPVRLVPASERSDLRVRAVESVENRPGASLLYADDHAYPEGGVFWTRDTERTTVLVSPAGASELLLTLFTGPRDSTVTLTMAGETRSVAVAHGATQDVALPIPPGQALVAFTVQSSTAFRPSEEDPASDDQRLLGCQTRVQLR